MALIKSLGIGKGLKSAGNLTYRVVRGRTIASEKVGSTAAIREAAYSNDGKLNKRCSAFGMMSKFASAHKASIIASFPKSKLGSEFNTFMKLNKVGFYAALQELAEAGGIATLAEIESAVATYAAANPTTIYRKRITASNFEYLTGAWNDGEDPAPTATVSAITGTINSSHVLTAIVVTGENLVNTLRCYVNGAMVNGSWSLNAAGTSGTFTLTTSQHIYGTATIAVKNGATTLKSGSVVGDPESAPTFTVSVQSNPGSGVTSACSVLVKKNGSTVGTATASSPVSVTNVQGSDTIELTATAGAGAQISGWTGTLASLLTGSGNTRSLSGVAADGSVVVNFTVVSSSGITLGSYANGGTYQTESLTMHLNVNGDLPSTATVEATNGASAQFNSDRSKVIFEFYSAQSSTVTIKNNGTTLYTVVFDYNGLPIGS